MQPTNFSTMAFAITTGLIGSYAAPIIYNPSATITTIIPHRIRDTTHNSKRSPEEKNSNLNNAILVFIIVTGAVLLYVTKYSPYHTWTQEYRKKEQDRWAHDHEMVRPVSSDSQQTLVGPGVAVGLVAGGTLRVVVEDLDGYVSSNDQITLADDAGKTLRENGEEEEEER